MMIKQRRWRRLARNTTRAGAAFSAAMLGVTVWMSAAPDIRGANAATNAGDARIVTPFDGSPTEGQQLDGGTATTDFTIVLPPGAACTGDATAGYRIQGYMVSAAIDPATLEFDNDGPSPAQFGEPQSTFRQPLYSLGSGWIGFPAAAAPGETAGKILDLPTFSLAPLDGGNVPTGEYNVGIACWKATGEIGLDNYWNILMTVTATGGPPATFTWSVEQATGTSTALAVDPAETAVLGDEVTLTATVTPAEATGTVTFKASGLAIGSPVAVSAGAASLATTELAQGSFDLTAEFTPDSDAFAPSFSDGVPFTITSNLTATTTSLAASPAGSAPEGDPVTLTATVTPNDAAGTVAFFDGGTAIGDPVTVSGGTATAETSELSAGTHSLTATFTPAAESSFGASTSSAVDYEITSELTATTVTLVVAPADEAEEGATVTLTATVSPSDATGTVTFLDGTTAIGDPVTVTNGRATRTTTTLAVGEHALAATFIPAEDSTFAAATSAAVAYEITAKVTSTTVTLAADPPSTAAVGQTITLTATVSPASATGTITFKINGVAAPDPVTVRNGRATIRVVGDVVGDFEFTAAYTPADEKYKASTSARIAYTFTEAATTTTTTGGTTTTAPSGVLGSSSGVSGGALPRTGVSLSALLWAVLLLVFGRAAVLLGRTPEVLPGAGG